MMLNETQSEFPTFTRSDALAPYQPRTLDEAFKLATYFAKSYLLGELSTPERVLLVMACAAELGIPVTAALRGFVVIDGQLAMRAYLKVALVMSRSECEHFRLIDETSEYAVWETKRRDREKARTWRYTIEEARAAGLPTDAHLLRSRCASALCTAEYPNIGFGLPAAEDLAVGAAPFGRDEDLPLSAPPQIVALPLVAPERDSAAAPPTEAETAGARMAQWKQMLETCTTSREADRVLLEMKEHFPDPKAPERRDVMGWHAGTMTRLAQARRAKPPIETTEPLAAPTQPETH